MSWRRENPTHGPPGYKSVEILTAALLVNRLHRASQPVDKVSSNLQQAVIYSPLCDDLSFSPRLIRPCRDVEQVAFVGLVSCVSCNPLRKKGSLDAASVTSLIHPSSIA